MFTRTIGIPSTNAVNWLLASTDSTLHVGVSVLASIPIVSGWTCNGISAAFIISMRSFLIAAWSVLTPLSQAVHWLGTAISGALLVCIGIQAAMSIVSSSGANGIYSASSVLVVIAVMLARCVITPSANTVHWLAATLGDALYLTAINRAGLSTQFRLGGDLVRSATLIYMLVGQ